MNKLLALVCAAGFLVGCEKGENAIDNDTEKSIIADPSGAAASGENAKGSGSGMGQQTNRAETERLNQSAGENKSGKP